MSSPAPPPSPNSESGALVLAKTTQELVLIIFIHGFKGTDATFNEFPNKLEHVLTEAVPDVKVECIIFPAYEVRPYGVADRGFSR